MCDSKIEKDEKVVSGMLLFEGCIWFAESFSEIMYTEDLANAVEHIDSVEAATANRDSRIYMFYCSATRLTATD